MDRDHVTLAALRAMVGRLKESEPHPIVLPCILPVSLYDQAKAAGYDMAGYQRGYPMLPLMADAG